MSTEQLIAIGFFIVVPISVATVAVVEALTRGCT